MPGKLTAVAVAAAMDDVLINCRLETADVESFVWFFIGALSVDFRFVEFGLNGKPRQWEN
jgi:hypothetical protein